MSTTISKLIKTKVHERKFFLSNSNSKEPLAKDNDPNAASKPKGAKMQELYKGDIGKKLKLDQAGHPGVCLATIFFKGASIFT
jgi:hypothetical protein